MALSAIAEGAAFAYRSAMSPLVETVLYIFGLVALGFASGRVGLLSTEAGGALNRFAISVAMPVFLFRAMASADFQGSDPWALWPSYFTAVAATWIAGHFAARHIFGRDRRAGIVAGMSTAFSNLVLLGLPFSREVFGQMGVEVATLIIAIHLPIMMGVTVLLLALENARAGHAVPPLVAIRSFLGQLLTNPLIMGIIAGLVWRFVDLPIPSVAGRLIDTLGGLAGPMALFAVGLSLLKFGLRGGMAIAFTVAMLKLFFMPAIALLMVKAVGLSAPVAMVVVVLAGMPIGVNPYLMATRFGVGERLASSAMTLSTMFAVLTTSFWVTLVQYLF